MRPTYKDMQKQNKTEVLSPFFRENADNQVVKSLLTKISAMEELLNVTVQDIEEIEGGAAEQFTAAMKLFKKLVKAEDILGILVLDHVIIGDLTWTSLKQLGLLESEEVDACLPTR